MKRQPVFATVLKNKKMSVGKNNKDYKKHNKFMQSDFAIQIYRPITLSSPFWVVPPRIESCCFFIRRDGVKGVGIPSKRIRPICH